MQLTAYAQLVTTAAIWGLSWMCGRIISSKGVPPLDAALARFLFGSLGLLAIMLLRGHWPRPHGRAVWKLVAMGFFGVLLYNICFFGGLRTVPAGRASLIASLQPVFVFLASLLIWRERTAGLKLFGLFLGLFGVAIVLSQGNPIRLFQGGLNTGDLWLVGCAGSWAAYTLIGRTTMKDMPAVPATAYSTWIGSAMLLVFAPPLSVNWHEWSAGIWLAAAFLGVFGTTAAFLLYLSGVKRIGASRASIFVNLVPVFAVVFSALLLNEMITTSTLAGGAIVLLGVFLLNR